MFPEKIIQKKITEEINLIPQETRQESYELIHNFRTNLNQKKSNRKHIVISNNNETLFRLKPFHRNKKLSQSKLK